MSEADEYEWHEIATLDGRTVRTIRGRCLHRNVEPVESVAGEVVAHLCLTCDQQLP